MRPQVLLALLLLCHHPRCQTILLGDTLKVSFLKLPPVISDSSQLDVKVVYQNIDNKAVFVYQELNRGYLQDRFANFEVDVERQSADSFIYVSTYSYRISDEFEFNPNYRHYDVSKHALPPHDRDTLTFNLIRDLLAYMDTGMYRIKLNLRVKTIQDTTTYIPDSTGATAFPLDQIEYIKSEWQYFRVVKRLQRPILGPDGRPITSGRCRRKNLA